LTSKEKLAARQVYVKKVSEEIVKLAEEIPCNTLLSLKEALQTYGIEASEKGIHRFYVSSEEDITACWRIELSKVETAKAFELGLIVGVKREKYQKIKRICERIRLVNPEEKVE
ncbi:MAG: hypothetical protein ACTSWF_08595, partial [Candidatus Freyarchaeota archaeon]